MTSMTIQVEERGTKLIFALSIPAGRATPKEIEAIHALHDDFVKYLQTKDPNMKTVSVSPANFGKG